MLYFIFPHHAVLFCLLYYHNIVNIFKYRSYISSDRSNEICCISYFLTTLRCFYYYIAKVSLTFQNIEVIFPLIELNRYTVSHIYPPHGIVYISSEGCLLDPRLPRQDKGHNS